MKNKKGEIKMKKYRNRGRPEKKPNKKEFELLYYNFEVPVEKLAERYNVKTKTIYNWAYQFRKSNN